MDNKDDILKAFQESVYYHFGALAEEYGLNLEGVDRESFRIILNELSIKIYLYPSHIPSINATLMPSGAKWSKWKKISFWGSEGIWLSHVAKYQDSDYQSPNFDCSTIDEVEQKVELLASQLRKYCDPLLRGDSGWLDEVIRFADRQVQLHQEREKLVKTIKKGVIKGKSYNALVKNNREV